MKIHVRHIKGLALEMQQNPNYSRMAARSRSRSITTNSLMENASQLAFEEAARLEEQGLEVDMSDILSIAMNSAERAVHESNPHEALSRFIKAAIVGATTKPTHAATVATSREEVITINVEERQMELHEFFSLCKQSLEVGQNKYCIKLAFRGASYHCMILLHHRRNPDDFKIYFYNTHEPCIEEKMTLSPTNKKMFMYLSIEDNMGDSALTTRNPFAPIPGLTSLQSIIYIRCRFYWMIGQDWYKITDAATGSCEINKETEYPLFLYRILCQKPDGSYYPLNELSIYYKFFTNKYHSYGLFEKYRQPIDFANPRFLQLVDAIRTDPRVMEKRREDPTFLPFYRNNPNCKKHSATLTELLGVLYNTEYNTENANDVSNFRELDGALTEFLVRNHECIYYPGSSESVALLATNLVGTATRAINMAAVRSNSPVGRSSGRSHNRNTRRRRPSSRN